MAKVFMLERFLNFAKSAKKLNLRKETKEWTRTTLMTLHGETMVV